VTVPTLEDIRTAARAGVGVIRETPVLSSRTLSGSVGGEVVLKAENLQRTGSFKLRGALAKLAALGDDCRKGVVAGSAGNHAQAVAYAARARGVPCEVFMPSAAPVAKVEAATALGAAVRLGGLTVDDAIAAARERAQETGMEYVHPFDDLAVIAGQGTLGLELLEQLGDDLRKVLLPVGGGGLASGVAIALKQQRPEIEVVGLQVPACATFSEFEQPTVAADDAAHRPLTIADGISVKRPGALTRPLVNQWVDRLVVVPEDDVAEAMIFLLERAKLVVEGAGAVGVAALLTGLERASAEGVTVVVLSGGNVDAGLLAQLASRHESVAGRRLVLLTRVPDSPGALARLLALVGDSGANLMDVQHVRAGFDLHPRETAVQLVLETRSSAHAEAVEAAVRGAGYLEPAVVR
jgi:threonine dehydratase